MSAALLHEWWGLFGLQDMERPYSAEEVQMYSMMTFNFGLVCGMCYLYVLSKLWSCCCRGYCSCGNCLFLPFNIGRSISQGNSSVQIMRGNHTVGGSMSQVASGINVFGSVNQTQHSSSKSYTEINGRRYYGNSVSVTNGGIYIDGVLQDQEDEGEQNVRYTPVSVHVHGDAPVESIRSQSASVTVEGNAGEVITQSGRVTIKGNCSGRCKTMSGRIDIGGDYTAVDEPSTMSGRVTIQGRHRRTQSRGAE